MTAHIIARGVGKHFPGQSAPALVGVDLDADAGAITAVVGASGSGKSTLLRLFGGLTEPSAGTVLVGGAPPDEVRRHKEVGWMAQRPALLPWRTVADNVALAQTINPRPGREVPDPAELLRMVRLAGAARAYPAELSGGMQQRAALARTLAIGAPLWLMDEPFSALDELTREELSTDLLTVWERFRPTVVWVTHHIPEAVDLADRIVVLSPSPGTVNAIVEVGLTRPRDRTAPAFQDVVRQVRSTLKRAQEVVAS